MKYSISPEGKRFPLPRPEDYAAEEKRIARLVEEKRKQGFEIVVVMGLGFVGAVMAAVVADSVDRKTGRPRKFVIGKQRPSDRSGWKIPYLNRGLSPVQAEDPEVARIIHRTVKQKKTLTATFTDDAIRHADVIIVDIQCDYLKESLGDLSTGTVEMRDLEESFHIIGRYLQPRALCLIETTVAPGTTERVAYPILKQAFARRGIKTPPLLAHSYERVMPGRNYVASIRDFWRVCAGVDAESRRRVEKFLREVIHTEQYPLSVLDRPVESETAKIVENSFRAAILAFMDEWSRFAEEAGVDLVKVIEAIKVRPTHSNIMFPGPGVGGYCLPKDGALGMWAYRRLFHGRESLFKFTPLAINVNDTRGLHAARLAVEALAEMKRKVKGARVLLLGCSYREEVGDTRYAGSELIVRMLTEQGAKVSVHDPYVERWWEFERQGDYPHQTHSLARFFKNQGKLKKLKVSRDLEASLSGQDAVIFAVRHRPYLKLKPEAVVKRAGKPLAVVDAFALLDDAKIRRYLELGCAVRGMGRGHIQRLKRELKPANKKRGPSGSD